MAHNFNDNTRNQKSTWQRARHSEPSKSPRQPSITPPPLPPNDEERVQFGADFIPFDIEFRVGEEIPRKRKIDAIESLESAPKPPKIARYEDGTFTMPWLNGFNFNESNVSKLYVVSIPLTFIQTYTIDSIERSWHLEITSVPRTQSMRYVV